VNSEEFTGLAVDLCWRTENRNSKIAKFESSAALVTARAARSMLAATQDRSRRRRKTKNESAAEVAKLLVGGLKRLGTDPVQGEELKSRQAVLTGGYARSLETNEGFADDLASLATCNLPLDRLNQWPSSAEGSGRS
jgi:hypothetical protein